MRNVLGSVAVVVCCGAAVAVPVEVTGSVAGYGRYMWRGWDVAPAGLFADSTLTVGLTDELSATGYVWNYTRIDQGWRTGEFDYGLGLAWSRARWSVAATWNYYDVASWSGIDSQDVQVTVEYDTPGQPGLDAFYDFDTGVGLYLALHAGQTWSLSPKLSLDAKGTLGLDFGRGVDTFNDFRVRSSLSYQLTSVFNLFAGLELSVPSHQIAPYGARVVPFAGVGYGASW